jgi:hypothetical protein
MSLRPAWAASETLPQKNRKEEEVEGREEGKEGGREEGRKREGGRKEEEGRGRGRGERGRREGGKTHQSYGKSDKSINWWFSYAIEHCGLQFMQC